MAGLAGRLALSGRSVKVLANGAPAGADATVPEPPFVLRRFGGWRPLRRWRKRRAIAALLAAGNVEGVFCDSWKSVEALPRRLGVPVAVLAHGAEYPVTPRPRKARRIMAALARCHAIIANSHFTADAVRRFLAWKGAGHRARKFRLTVMARSCRTGLSRVEPVRVSRPECVIAIRCSGRCPGQCSRPQVAILHMPYMKKTFFSFNVLLKYSHLGPLPLKAWRSGQNCHAFFC